MMHISEQARIGVLMRKAQWLLDDGAYYILRNELDREDYMRVADTLDELSALLRTQAEHSQTEHSGDHVG